MNGGRDRWLRRSRLLPLLSLVVAAVVLAGTSPARAVGELSEVGERGFADIASCASAADNLLVMIVVDESSSLRTTDPQARRVDAILTALDGLENLGATTDVSVQAALAVFGESFTALVDWGEVEGGHARSLRDATHNQIPSRNRSDLTDYRSALSEAQRSLAARAQELGGTSCKLMLWLTDGKLDVDGTGDGPATDAARDELCRPGGTVDGVRADGVAILALGLLTSQAQGSVTSLDRNRLQAVAEGGAGSESCGTVPVSGAATGGAFLNAADAGALNRIFAQTVALVAGGSSGRSVVCPSDECVDGRLSVPVDAGVGGFRLVLEATDGAPAPQLVAPSGETVVLDRSVGSLAGAGVSVLAANGLVTIDVRDAARSPGSWTLVTDPATTTIVDLYYFWGVTLGVEAPDGVVVGETSEIRVVALDRAGSPVDLSVFGSATFEATIDGEPATFTAGESAWTAELTVPIGDAVSALTLSGRAAAVTTPHGIELGPVAVEQSVETEFPPSFPTVTPPRLDLGRLADATTATATLTVTGADRGATRACFGPGTVTAPERAGTVTLGADPECVDVAPGTSTDVVVTLTAQESADGWLDGTLPVELLGVDEGDRLDVGIPVSGTMVRPVDERERWGLVLLLLAGAALLAWLVAAGLRWGMETFRLSTFARYAAVPVLVDANGIRRADGGTPLVRADAMRAPAQRGSRRSLRLGPASYRVRYPANPLAQAQGVVTGSGGQVPISDRPESTTDPSERMVGLPGSTGFVVITDRPRPGTDGAVDESAISGTLVLVVDPGRTRTHADLLPDRLRDLGETRWGAEVERAHRAWRAVAGSEAAPSGPSGSARTGGTVGSDAATSAVAAPPGPRAPADVPPPRRSGTAGQDGTGRPPDRHAPAADDRPPARRLSDPESQGLPPPRRGPGPGSAAGAAPSRPGSESLPPPRRGAGEPQGRDPAADRGAPTDPDDLPPPRR